MSVAEETYKLHVGEEGYTKSEHTFEALLLHETNPHVREGAKHLYYLQLLNAFYRGHSSGVAEARSAMRSAGDKTK